jgi:hypothetical protein
LGNLRSMTTLILKGCTNLTNNTGGIGDLEIFDNP